MNQIEIGRLLRASTSGLVVGCRVSQVDAPAFGAMVLVPVDPAYQIYGLIYDIHIDDDGLVRQLITAEGVNEDVIADNRLNRNVPLEMSVLSIGYRLREQYFHAIPPRPPLSLDSIYLCDAADVLAFTSTGRFGYFRHILRSQDLPVGELLAAHLQQAGEVHRLAGDIEWLHRATQELIILLRDDYPSLIGVLSALGDVYPDSP